MWSEILLLLCGIPVGFLLAYWSNDELIQGRKWFVLLGTLSLVAGAYASFAGLSEVVWMCGFVLVVTGISYWKSFDRKWCRKRID